MPLLSGESGAASTNPFLRDRRAINKKEIPLRNILLLENRRRNHPVDTGCIPGACGWQTTPENQVEPPRIEDSYNNLKDTFNTLRNSMRESRLPFQLYPRNCAEHWMFDLRWLSNLAELEFAVETEVISLSRARPDKPDKQLRRQDILMANNKASKSIGPQLTKGVAERSSNT